MTLVFLYQLEASFVIDHLPYFSVFLVFNEEVVSELLKFIKNRMVEVQHFLKGDSLASPLQLQQPNQSPHDKIETPDAQNLLLQRFLAEQKHPRRKVPLDLPVSYDKNINFVDMLLDMLRMQPPKNIKNIVMYFINIFNQPMRFRMFAKIPQKNL